MRNVDWMFDERCGNTERASAAGRRSSTTTGNHKKSIPAMRPLDFLEIRPERITEFNEIACLVASAFEINFLDENRPAWFLPEVTLVDYLRRQRSYVNNLSLVALLSNQVVGYIVMTPMRMTLYGSECEPVSLSILAVAPQFQRRGIGTALVKESMGLASARGHPFCFLFGHEAYYSRFGFETHCFGNTFIEVVRSDFAGPSSVGSVQVQPLHIQKLIEMHSATFGTVNLSNRPGKQIIEWKSSVSCLESVVLTEGGRVIGYARYLSAGGSAAVKLLISDSPGNAAKAITFLFGRFSGIEKLRLPLHPASPVVAGLKFEGTNHPIGPGMIAVLDERFEAIKSYLEEVRRTPSQCGMVTFPIGYDTI
jgi:predicted N-acetyltransferase YhbS